MVPRSSRRFSGRRWVSVDMYRHGSRDRGFAADRGIASGETEARTERPAMFRDNSILTGSYRILSMERYGTVYENKSTA